MKKLLSSIIYLVLIASLTLNSFAYDAEPAPHTDEQPITASESAIDIADEVELTAEEEPIESQEESVSLMSSEDASAYSEVSLTETEIYMRYFDSLLGNSLNAAYTPQQSDAYVDTATGSMAANVTDLYIAGKNGLDICVNRSFNTASSPLKEFCEDEKNSRVDYAYALVKPFVCQYTKDGQTKTANVNVYFDNEMELLYAGTRFEGKMYTSSENYYSKLTNSSDTSCVYTCAEDAECTKVYDTTYFVPSSLDYQLKSRYTHLGNGWQLQYPGLATVNHYTETTVDSNGDSETKKYVSLIFTDRMGKSHTAEITLEDDGEWEMNYSKVRSGYDHEIKFVANGDISVGKLHPAGFTYNMTITTDNGDVYYFDSTVSGSYYEILGISDRYGNVILIDQDNYTYTITDTYGVRYVCTHSGIVRICNDVETELVKYEFESINSDLDMGDKYDVDNEYIFTVTRNSGTTNTIAPDEVNKTSYYIKQAYKYDKGLDDCTVWLIYSLPYKVVYPTGLIKHFEYQKHDEWEIGYEKDTVPGYYYTVSDYSETDESGADLRNHTSYAYTFGKVSGCNVKYVKGVVATAYEGDDIVNVCESKYLSNQLLTSSKVTDADGRHYVKDSYSYFSDSPKGRIEIHTNSINTYDADGNENVYSHKKEYTYSKNRLLSETNGDYVCNYTYYEADNYYLPHTVAYNRDANTTIMTENLLTADGKNIATANVYENNILKATTHYTYDTVGNIASATIPREDGTNATTLYSYTYLPAGGYTVTSAQTGIADADGNALSDIVAAQTCDWRGNVTSATDALGNTTTTTYDMANRPLCITYPDGNVESYAYDMSANTTTLTAKTGALYRAEADEWGNRISIERRADSSSPTETMQTSAYNSINQLESTQRHYDNNSYTQAEYAYDFNNRIIEEKISNNNSPVRTTTFAYSADKPANGYRRLVTRSSISGDEGAYATCTQYLDYMENTSMVEYIYDTDKRTYTYAYDYVGNLLSESDPAGNTTSYTYDYANRPLTVTDAVGSTKTYAYNSLGQTAAESDFMGNATTYTYDNAGRAITSTTPFDDSGNGFAKSYYDPNGNVIASYIKSNTADEADNYTRVTNGYDCMNRLVYTTSHPTDDKTIYTQYMYDNIGNLQKVISGITQLLDTDDSIPSDAWYTLYEYDNYGRVVKMTTPDGKHETYSYDYQDRLIADADRAGRAMTYAYDDFDNLLSKERGSEKVTYTYNLAGQRTSMAENDATSTTYAYDPFGQLTSETRGGIIKTSQYDAAGNRISFAVSNNGASVLTNTYAYDALGRISAVTNGNDTVSYTYDANSNQITAAKNGAVYQKNKYNRANLTVESHSFASATTADVTTYTYALDGNMRSKLSVPNGAGNLYYYDGAGRLISETAWGSDYDYSHTYDYDNRGNRLTLAETDNSTGTSTTTEYIYNNMNQLLSVNDGTDEITYTYDAVGNRERKHLNEETMAVYNYDAFNRLVYIMSFDEHPSAIYTYDGDNLRQTKDIYGAITAHIYDGANVVADIADTTTTFIRGNSLELLKPQSGTASLYITSPRGDTTKLINSDGTYTQYEYSAFGTEVTGNNIADNPFEYCGEYYDDESGLIYLRNRYYDPEIGRFINEDPIEDGLNWYVYCANNPINFVDPIGLYDVEITEDGKVYAIIEPGDTLSYIAKDQVNDPQAYKKMNYSGDPNSIYPGQKIEITGIYNNQYPIDNVIAAKQKPNFTPNPNKRKGSENRQPTGSREKNVGHPDGEEHSRVPKGNNGIRRAETRTITNDSMETVATIATIGTILTGATIFLLPIP